MEYNISEKCKYNRPKIEAAKAAYSRSGVDVHHLLEDYAATQLDINDLKNKINALALLKTRKSEPFEHGRTKHEELFNNAAFSIKDEKPTDVIETLFYSSQANNPRIEYDFVLPVFHESLNDDDYILVVNASPEVIRRFKDSKYWESLTFICSDETVSEVYSTQYMDRPFESISAVPFKTIHYSKILIFCHDTPVDKLLSCMDLLEPDGQIFAVLPDTVLSDKELAFFPALEKKGIYVTSVTQIPTALTKRSTKKDLFVLQHLPAAPETVSVFLSAFDSGRSVLSVSDTPLLFPYKEFISTFSTISQRISSLTRKDNIPKEKQRNTVLERYHFSNEIILHYLVLNNRKGKPALRVSYHSIDQSSGGRYGKTIVPGYECCRADTVEDAVARIEAIVYGDIFSHAICNNLVENYHLVKDSLSLKTLWFLNREKLVSLKSYDDEIAKELFSPKNWRISDLIPQTSLDSEYFDAMEASFESNSEKIPLKYWLQLNLIVNSLIKSGFLKFNPISEKINELSARASKKEREIINALQTRTLSQAQFERVLNSVSCSERKGNEIVALSNFFCMMLKLFSSLTYGELCALTWGDILFLQEVELYQIFINKKIDMAGNIVMHSAMSNFKYLIRLFPLTAELESIYLRTKDLLLSSLYHDSEGAMNLSPILVSLDSVNAIQSGKKAIFSNTKYARHLTDVFLGNAQIRSNIIRAPMKNGIMKNIDLSEYSGDIFRNTFRLNAKDIAKLTPDETAYLMGKAPDNTFSQHYCDYADSLSQFQIAEKLHQWTVKYADFFQPLSSRSTGFKPYIGDFNGHSVIGSDNGLTASTSLYLDSEQKDEFTLEIDCEHGFCISFV